MNYRDLRDFIAQLEARGQLKRIAVPVDPYLEITEICDRTLRLGGLNGEIYLDVTNATNRLNAGGYTYSGGLENARQRTSRLLPAFPTLGFKVSW